MARNGVFVNYRSRDEVFAVEMIDARLVEVFGRDQVFLDHHTLPAGEDFRPLLWEQLRISRVLLVLIGGRWLELADPSGRRLLDREDDFVRSEIRTALAADKVMIPVLLDGAALPTKSELPADIAGLISHQYRTVARKDVAHGIEQVVDAVRPHVPAIDTGERSPTPSPGQGGPTIGHNSGQAVQGDHGNAIGTMFGNLERDDRSG